MTRICHLVGKKPKWVCESPTIQMSCTSPILNELL